MSKYEASITITKELAEQLEGILSIEEGTHPDYGRDEVIHVETAIFANGFEADIKLCNGNTPYVDPVLFDETGCGRCLDEFDDTFLGEYEFHLEDDVYFVYVKVEENSMNVSINDEAEIID